MRFRETYVESRLNSIFLISGKLIRFAFFFIFIIALLTPIGNLAGFTLVQTLVFYMTFNLIDITSQFISRGVYAIRYTIDSGQLDYFLTQPVNVLFRIFSDTIDILDFTTLVPLLVILGVVIVRLQTYISLGQFLLYLLLCVNGLLIAVCIHVFIIALSVMTQEVSSEIWIYRDLMTMGRFPVDIYAKPIQIILTLLVPVAVMISFPAKVLMGVLAPQWIIGSLLIGSFFLSLAIWFWRLALKKYSSISI